MSQSRQSNATAAAPAGTSPEADTLVEAYAEDLMDEIFDDVDRILAGDESAIYASSTAVSEGSSSLFSAEAVTVPAMIVPFTGEPSVEARSAAPFSEANPGRTNTDKKTAASEKPAKKRHWRNFLLGAVCLSACTGLGIWWMRQQPYLQSTAAPAVPTAPAVSQETAFGEYLQRSLRVIGGERTAQRESQKPGVLATAPVNNPAGTQAPKQSGGGVIERVFVPMLQPNSTNPLATRNTPASPSTVTRGSSSSTSSSSRASLPAPTIAGQSNSNNQSNGNGTVPNIATASTYELVGVLELGDRSAALFEVDGSSQRVYIGETIGGSGWSIVSISNEEVVVRRNGEVRSIYIGQKF
ncbi:type II secretion system protein N [Leptothoe spongobia]|uniref:Type II secretion system protein GspC N-terminal domain-containing protein n=1 Tax=Leptothoe spongobia TAU-MAC 1115 TaxID=1967444 RepID=A0A947DEU7_9CYAN|nr:type II secretion system protein N [Leptothoe spongobia]MBT9315104.1 hypothetical protein [Leptothoe spongobia TAU-MAC 1115]